MLYKILIPMLALCLSVSAHADHSGMAPAAAGASPVNIAGEGRVLSQRIARTYAQIGLGVMPTVARAQLRESISRFDSNLDALEPLTAGSPEASLAYRNLTQVWLPFRAATNEPVSRDAAFALSRQSLEVLDAADRLTRALEENSTDANCAIVNSAGRLRMHSQRLAKAYLLLSWGSDSSEMRNELETTATEFADRLAWLIALSDNTPEIRTELEEIGLQLTWMQNAIGVEGEMFYLLVVVRAADAILVATDHLTRLFDQRHGE